MKRFLALISVLCARPLLTARPPLHPISFLFSPMTWASETLVATARTILKRRVLMRWLRGHSFQHRFGTPLCGPSRALLLSGRYGFRTGMTGNGSGENLKSASEVMIPKVLKPAGYVTGCFGKWGHLPLQPSDFGFDEVHALPE